MTDNKISLTYKRQQFLLAFISQLKDSVSGTDLQKLMFLYMMKENSNFYEFIPYKFGAYSFQLQKDIEILRSRGYLQQGERIKAVKQDHSYGLLSSIAEERSTELIRKSYREYPYYTINSEIINQHFSGEEADKLRNERQKIIQAKQILFTIGYEKKTIEAYMNILIKNDIRILCDVRKNPLSRKFGFSKKKFTTYFRTGRNNIHSHSRTWY